MVKDGRCRWAGHFLLSPTLLGLGSGRFLCRWVTCLGLLVFRAGFATSLLASAAVVVVTTVAPLAGLLILTTFASLVLLVLFAVPHRSGTWWAPGGKGRGCEWAISLTGMSKNRAQRKRHKIIALKKKKNVYIFCKSWMHSWNLRLGCNKRGGSLAKCLAFIFVFYFFKKVH